MLYCLKCAEGKTANKHIHVHERIQEKFNEASTGLYGVCENVEQTYLKTMQNIQIYKKVIDTLESIVTLQRIQGYKPVSENVLELKLLNIKT
jgi:hypothetical protein